MTANYSGYFGKYPAVVASYDAASRHCTVSIPGITDGGDVLPSAEIEYPVGDKSKSGAGTTEILILPGDMVWIMFQAGDRRYPIITGWRCPGIGNSTGTRSFTHANIALTADNLMTLLAATLNINVTTMNVTGNLNVTGDVITTGVLKNNGKQVGSALKVSGVQSGGGTSGNPI